MRILLTGANGFVGRHVLAAAGKCQIIALPPDVDLRNFAAVSSFICGNIFDSVLHLAALSSVKKSFESPEEVFDVNVNGTRNLLLGLRKAKFNGRLLLVSTGEVYGAVKEECLPVAETQTLAPISPYAKSKVAMEELVTSGGEFSKEKFASIIVRPFNHIGPGQSPDFFVGSVVDQIAKHKLKLRSGPLMVGNLQVTRDFTDVRDIVRAYFQILQSKSLSESIFNIGSGAETKLSEIISTLIRAALIQVETLVDPGRLRRVEQLRMCADVTRLRQQVDWRPSYNLTQTLADALTQRLNELRIAGETNE